jgi:hypothetical protein
MSRPLSVPAIIATFLLISAPALAQAPAEPAKPAEPAAEKDKKEKKKDGEEKRESGTTEGPEQPDALVGGPVSSEVGGPPVELPHNLLVQRDFSFTVGSGFDSYVGPAAMISFDAVRTVRDSSGQDKVERVRKYFHVTTNLSVSKSYKGVEGGLTYWNIRFVPITEGSAPAGEDPSQFTEKYVINCMGMIPGGYKADCSIAFRAYNWNLGKDVLGGRAFFSTAIQLAAARWLQKVDSGAMTGVEPVRINTVAGFSRDVAKGHGNLTGAAFSEERVSWFVKPGSNFAREHVRGWSVEFTLNKVKGRPSVYFGRTDVKSWGLDISGGHSYQMGLRLHPK